MLQRLAAQLKQLEAEAAARLSSHVSFGGAFEQSLSISPLC
eukprot:SAG11_NODE_2100_length_3826_cov_40.900456_2_plen_41_part_00